jgi:hypothetical protein
MECNSLTRKPGVLRVLDSAASAYSGLTWRKESSDLAVLRSKSDDRHEGPTQIGLAWKALSDANAVRQTFDPTADTQFPTGMRTVAFRRPSWSQDGSVVFLGIAKWQDKPPADKKPAAKEDGNANNANREPAKDEEEPAGVDVWNARDVIVMPRQKLDARADRQRSLLAAWHLDTGRLVQLGRDRDEQVTPIKYQKLALATNWTAYAMERTIGRPAADLYLIDTTNGERTKLKGKLDEDRYVQPSPGGHYLIYVEGDHYWTVNTATRAVANITKSVQTSFVDRESDFTIKQKPMFGVAGWSKNDESVFLYDKFDIWQIAPDGSRAKRLTDGSAEQIRHRYLRLNADEEFIDPEKPLYLSLFGIWSKKSGYARLRLNTEPNGWSGWIRSIQRLAKAKDADVYSYVAESFDDSPDIFVGNAALKEAKQVTNTNSFQTNYAWGRFRPGRIQDAARRAIAGSALLSGWLRSRQKVSHGRLSVRAIVRWPSSLQRTIRARLLQRRRLYSTRLLSFRA